MGDDHAFLAGLGVTARGEREVAREVLHDAALAAGAREAAAARAGGGVGVEAEGAAPGDVTDAGVDGAAGGSAHGGGGGKSGGAGVGGVGGGGDGPAQRKVSQLQVEPTR